MDPKQRNLKMFGGGDFARDNDPNYPTQWALNPSAYRNVSSENVDWAALAQQWIQMKESAPPEHPSSSVSAPSRKEQLSEGGEAPMDVVENDREEADWSADAEPTDAWHWQRRQHVPPPQTQTQPTQSASQQSEPHWSGWPGGWDNGGSSGGGGGPTPPASGVKAALLPTPYSSQYSGNNAPDTVAPNVLPDYPSSYDADCGSTTSGGYWTGGGSSTRPPPAVRGRPGRRSTAPDTSRSDHHGSDEMAPLDAAKRRQLPAWIRDGLEKMERDKQKQLDKERERLEREQYAVAVAPREKPQRPRRTEEADSGQGGTPEPPPRPASKFDSDGEDSSDSGDEDHEEEEPREAPNQMQTALVRRLMTEVLLKVTTTEIEIICREELNKFRSNRRNVRSSSTRKTGGRSATTISGSPSNPAAGTLGLGMYGGDSGSDTPTTAAGEEGGGSQSISDNDADSDVSPANEQRAPAIGNGPQRTRRRDNAEQDTAEIERRQIKGTSGNGARSSGTNSSGHSDNRKRRPAQGDLVDGVVGGGAEDDRSGSSVHSQVDTARPHGDRGAPSTPPPPAPSLDHKGRLSTSGSSSSTTTTSGGGASDSGTTSDSDSSREKRSSARDHRRQHVDHRRSVQRSSRSRRSARSRSYSSDSSGRRQGNRRDRRPDRDQRRERDRRTSYRRRSRSRTRSRSRSRSRRTRSYRPNRRTRSHSRSRNRDMAESRKMRGYVK